MSPNAMHTVDQFLEIDDDVYNGNWRDAATKCVENGFFAIDLCTMKAAIDNEEISGYCFMDYDAIAMLAELTCKYRCLKHF